MRLLALKLFSRRMQYPLVGLMSELPESRSRQARYGYTLLAIGLALLISLIFRSIIHPYPFTLFWFVVAFSAWYGGFRPSLLAIVLMVPLVNYFFVTRGSPVDFSTVGFVRIATITAIAITLSLVHYQGILLNQAQDLFRVALSSIGDGVIVADTQSNVMFLNPVAEAMIGWKREEVTGKRLGEVFRIINEETREPAEDPVQKVLQSNRIVGLANHTLLITRDGQEFPIADSGAPIRNQKGEVLGAVLVFRDVSLERWAESALEHSEVRFRTLTDTAPVMVWVADTDKLCTYFNPQWLKFTGKTMQQELGNGWAEGVHPDDRERILETFTTAFDRLESFIMEYRLRHFTGAYYWILDNGIPHYDVDGRFIGYIGSCIDINERKRNEERIMVLQQLTAALSSAITPEEVADVIVTSTLSVVGGQIGIVAMLAPDQSHVNIIRAQGAADKLVSAYQSMNINSRLPIVDSIREQKIIWLETVEAYLTAYPDMRTTQKETGTGAVICLPLTIKEKTIGAFGITFNAPVHLTDEDRAFLMTLAQHCAQAMDRAQLYEGAKTLAAIEERQRLARDLHDAISQTLFSVNLIAESLPRLLNHDPEKMRANLEKLRLLSRGAHAEMRIMLMELRSEHLLLGSIEEQFEYLVATLTGRQSITVSLKVALETESNSLPSDVHEAFYRITQEALSNISKHSKATHVDLQLIREDDAIKLLVQDNGKGFVVDEVTRSLGMSTMSERAANIGAAFELSSEPGKGTRIGVVWNPED